ncbi:LanC-like protein [Mesorhizobium sp. INR15]|uniref:lanthionine synthetase C family protein n=1 Tax=Mesorhizobium sp. INR15 TaxID=2654248 RepID=UPI00189652A8|nr:LanC-like protein [Mesorhizobium sp. INR15]QPC91705.1 lanthionine synthetase [Mesorhizobium sp. INR15]
MLEQSRHIGLPPIAWNPDAARNAIDEIVADALDHFSSDNFWPSHPAEDRVPHGQTGFYYGATGTIWALHYLQQVGATTRAFDFRGNLPHLVAANRKEFARRMYRRHGSFHFGDMGTALLAMRLDPTAEYADHVHQRAQANNKLPIREFMWGMAGSMLACVHMAGLEPSPRWRDLFQLQAARLLKDLRDSDDGPLWIQALYGRKLPWLGPVHGFAGNMIPLLAGWSWLDPQQQMRVQDAICRVLVATAWQSPMGANWAARAKEEEAPKMCQHCHGAAGMVTSFASAPFTTPEFEDILRKGAAFTWEAGPLAKGSNLCHGTGGNGYALLKIHARTGDRIWLDRARGFAMTAIEQCDETRKHVGRGRYSLWTGDIGLAVYLWDCLTARPNFPTIDVF